MTGLFTQRAFGYLSWSDLVMYGRVTGMIHLLLIMIHVRIFECDQNGIVENWYNIAVEKTPYWLTRGSYL